MNRNYLLATHQIIRTGHWITDQVTVELKEFGITEPQYNVLKILQAKKGDPITVHEIQKGMIQRSSNVTRIIDKLIDKGLVLRSECPSNRRKMDNSITDSGNQLLKKLDEKVLRFHQPMAKNITQDEAILLLKLIKKLKGEK